jgi:hypothetical protein
MYSTEPSNNTNAKDGTYPDAFQLGFLFLTFCLCFSLKNFLRDHRPSLTCSVFCFVCVFLFEKNGPFVRNFSFFSFVIISRLSFVCPNKRDENSNCLAKTPCRRSMMGSISAQIEEKRVKESREFHNIAARG